MIITTNTARLLIFSTYCNSNRVIYRPESISEVVSSELLHSVNNIILSI